MHFSLQFHHFGLLRSIWSANSHHLGSSPARRCRANMSRAFGQHSAASLTSHIMAHMFAALSLPITGYCEVESVNEALHLLTHLVLSGFDLGGLVVVAGCDSRLQTMIFSSWVFFNQSIVQSAASM